MKEKLFLPLFFIFAQCSYAQHIDLDPTFGSNNNGIITGALPNSVRNNFNDIITQPDGKILAAGRTQLNSPGFPGNFLIGRYSIQGVADNTFGTNGFNTISIGTDAEINSLALQSNNQIIAAGRATVSGISQFALARFNSDGSVDKNFGTNGMVTTPISAGCVISKVIIQSTGNIVAIGSSVVNGAGVITLARYTPSGALDATFGSSGIVQTQVGERCAARSGVLTSNDEILVAGFSADPIDLPIIVKYSADGSVDSSFGSGGVATLQLTTDYAQARAIGLQSTGNIIIAGNTSINSLNNLLAARFSPTGVLDMTFGPNNTGTQIAFLGQQSLLNSMKIQSNDTISIAGALLNFSTVVRLTADGIFDNTFGSSGVVTTSAGNVASASAVTASALGKIIVSGFSDQNFFIAQYMPNNTPYITITTPAASSTITTGTTLISGVTSETGVIVTVSIDGVQFAQTTSDANGNWSVGTSNLLCNGSHTVTAQFSLNSVVTSTTNTFTIAATNSIVISNPVAGTTLNQNALIIQGYASNSSGTVDVLIDGTLFTTVSINSNCGWSTPTATLVNGSHTITARLTVGGSLVASSTTTSFTVNADTFVGNYLVVDAVFGNNATGKRNGPAFLTINAALAAAQPGDTIHVYPGNYNETFTIPSRVSVIGQTIGVIVNQAATSATDLITMGEYSSLEHMTLNLTSTQHVQLRGIVFPGTTSATARARMITLTVDNSGASSTGTSNVYGIHSTGTGSSAPNFYAVEESQIAVNSVGNGVKRGVLLDTDNAINMRDVAAIVQSSGGIGSYIGAETNSPNSILAFKNGCLGGTTADISQTTGTLVLIASHLMNSNANGFAFTTAITPSSFVWGASGTIATGTSFMVPGTNSASPNESFVRIAQPTVVKNISVQARVSPGAGNTVSFVVRKNGIDTISLNLSDSQTLVTNDTQSISCTRNDTISVRVSTSAVSSTCADAVLTMYLF